MSMHLNLATGQLLNSSNLIKIADSLILDRKSGKIVLSNLLVPRAGALPTLFGDATLDLNFASSLSLDDAVSGNNLVTFTRASSGTYVGSDGLIKTAVTDAPRFDHDPVTGESLGLLIEESRTNSTRNSTDLSPSSFYVGSSGQPYTFSTNQTTSPDGTITAGSILFTGAQCGFAIKSTGVTATTITVSLFAKYIAGSVNTHVRIQLSPAGGNNNYGLFNLTTGAFSTSGSVSSVTMTPFPNGWYRCSVTATHSTTWPQNSGDIRIWFHGATPTQTPINNTDRTYVWGVQLEAGAFPTSYIPTTSSTVTRAAELCSILGTNYTSLFGTTLGSGSIFHDVKVLGERNDASSGTFSSFSTNNNDQFTSFTTYDNRLTVGFLVPNANIDQYRDLTGVRVKSAVSWTDLEQPIDDQANASHALDGVLYGGNLYLKTNNPLNADYDRFGIGRTIRSITTHNSINGHISRLAYFPTRKAAEDLVSLTLPTVITYGITSPGGVFNLRSLGTVDYEVDWELTGSREASTENVLPHTYTAGDYTLDVYSDGVYRPYFNNSGDEDQITSVAIGSEADLGTDLSRAWYGANNITSFVCPFDVTSAVTSFSVTWFGCANLADFPSLNTSSGADFGNTWANCSSLTNFPELNTSSGINFSNAWKNCSSLTNFPLLNTSSGTNFSNAWRNCSSLTSFPELNTSSGTNFSYAWADCSSLTNFPLLDTSSGTSFFATWYNCTSLTSFPANMFDTTGTLAASAFNFTWQNCALTAQSIEHILVSLDTNGATGITLSIDGGTNAAKTTWSTAAVTAYDNLIVKGWTISFNA